MNSLNQPPRQAAPGRSALNQQLQTLNPATRLPPPGASQPEVKYYGHDPIESGQSPAQILTALHGKKKGWRNC